MYIVFITEIIYNDDKTMGIAIGGLAKPIKSRFTYDSWYIYDIGLVIFLFDKEGNILEIIFIPFKDLEGNMKQMWGKIKEKLEQHGVSLQDFYYLLDKLADYCDRICDFCNDTSGVLAAASMVLGGYAFIGCLPCAVAGLGAAGLAYAFHIGSQEWDHWRDILEAIIDIVIHELL
jgi:hypothetical protein